MRIISILTFVLFFSLFSVYAEDGSALWLRYSTGAKAIIMNKKQSPTLNIAVSELRNFWQGGIPITLEIQKNKELRALGNDGYIIRASKDGNHLTITSSGEQGILYGTYHLLRLQATGQLSESTLKSLNVSEKPDYRIRVLNHWDNLDGTIERGYAGHSLWKWDELPSVVSPRYEAYARANASIGINATVINNVNASPKILSDDYLQKVKVLADIFRPYGLKIYLSINFSSPAALGGLSTSDPLDKEVIAWWKKKAKDIYSLIPDFGGFLVKANSEGQPGPCDYGRTHAEGANMLADVLKPYRGIVMWRAFVYSPTDSDRAKQAYLEFEPLDGKFRDNVIVQIKNGPIDFQPREPFSPLFGAMKKTPVMLEFQITQEYLGFSNHLVFLAPMWKECLDSDTYVQGAGSTIARVTDGSLFPHSLTAIAGVTNIGDDINWCGHPFAQANWYAFGRLAWNPEESTESITSDWIKSTWNCDEATLEVIRQMMMPTWESFVCAHAPYSLGFTVKREDHYTAGFEQRANKEWHVSKESIGTDRTTKGTNYVSQYFKYNKDIFNSLSQCPELYLLCFHNVPWSHKMKSGKSLREEFKSNLKRGIEQVDVNIGLWKSIRNKIDPVRYEEVLESLYKEQRDTKVFYQAALNFFSQYW